MSDALAIAASGLRSEEHYISKIANDLANLNTPNYKATKLTFEDAIGMGTMVSNSSKDFSNGPLKPTNYWGDVAIDGNGFFQVINLDGNIAYTRNSRLGMDSERYLVTNDGYRLADNIQIPEDAIETKIQKNGDVEVILKDETEPQLIGNIKLAKFMNPEALESTGSGLYLATEKTGDALIDAPGNSGMGDLLQGQIEASNVDMVNSLMELTMAQRIYQLNAKAVEVADEMERMTNEIRD